jgi:exocyst complex protein 7
LFSDLDIPGIPQGPLQNLAILSSYLSTFGPELSYNSDFVKVYIEVRSTYLTKSLKTLAQGSINTAEKRSTPVYEKGTCGFNSYTDALLKMFKVFFLSIKIFKLDFLIYFNT